MRHKVDVYMWKEIPVARMWPRKANYVRSAAELATQSKMAAVAAMTGGIDATTRQAYIDTMFSARGVTWVDFFRSIAMGNSDWIDYG